MCVHLYIYFNRKKKMIIFVYCYICLLLVYCQANETLNEDYSNDYLNDDSNDYPDTKPKVEFYRYKDGAEIILKCKDHHYEKESISWDFKPCVTNLNDCDKDNIYTINTSDPNWKKLDYRKGKTRFKKQKATQEDIGIYRCLSNNSIIKIYMVEVIAMNIVPPKIMSLYPSENCTVDINESLTIQCKTTSIGPPEVRWLKDCRGKDCEIRNYNGDCYCSIPKLNWPNSIHTSGDGVYLSKMIIHKAKVTDSGVYTCFAFSQYGRDFKNVTVKVNNFNINVKTQKSFSLLFIIPLGFVLVPVTVWAIWFCYNRQKTKNRKMYEQKQFIKRVPIDIVSK